VVIDQVDVTSVAFLKPEDDPPVHPYRHAPKSLEAAFQGMEPETGQVHVFRLAGTVQNGKDIFYFLEVIGADAFGFPVLEEPFEALVPEALNHKP
jgi:hypothetical protein